MTIQIKTARGYRPLQDPPGLTRVPFGPPRYHGPLPSKQCMAFIAGLEQAHVEWVERRRAMKAES